MNEPKLTISKVQTMLDYCEAEPWGMNDDVLFAYRARTDLPRLARHALALEAELDRAQRVVEAANEWREVYSQNGESIDARIALADALDAFERGE